MHGSDRQKPLDATHRPSPGAPGSPSASLQVSSGSGDSPRANPVTGSRLCINAAQPALPVTARTPAESARPAWSGLAVSLALARRSMQPHFAAFRHQRRETGGDQLRRTTGAFEASGTGGERWSGAPRDATGSARESPGVSGTKRPTPLGRSRLLPELRHVRSLGGALPSAQVHNVHARTPTARPLRPRVPQPPAAAKSPRGDRLQRSDPGGQRRRQIALAASRRSQQAAPNRRALTGGLPRLRGRTSRATIHFAEGPPEPTSSVTVALLRVPRRKLAQLAQQHLLRLPPSPGCATAPGRSGYSAATPGGRRRGISGRCDRRRSPPQRRARAAHSSLASPRTPGNDEGVTLLERWEPERGQTPAAAQRPEGTLRLVDSEDLLAAAGSTASTRGSPLDKASRSPSTSSRPFQAPGSKPCRLSSMRSTTPPLPIHARQDRAFVDSLHFRAVAGGRRPPNGQAGRSSSRRWLLWSDAALLTLRAPRAARGPGAILRRRCRAGRAAPCARVDGVREAAIEHRSPRRGASWLLPMPGSPRRSRRAPRRERDAERERRDARSGACFCVVSGGTVRGEVGDADGRHRAAWG